MSAPKWIVWDWNGTLLDDTRAVLNAVNVMLKRRDLPLIDLAFYRAEFAFPAKSFYTRCGIELENEDWDALAREYHDAYAAEAKDLNRAARKVLETVRARGIRQAILSAHHEELLRKSLVEYGIAAYFELVYGADNLDGGSKEGRGRKLLAELRERGVEPEEVVMIGDSIHDAEVARALGFRALLCAEGGHSPERLQMVAPTALTLEETITRIDLP